MELSTFTHQVRAATMNRNIYGVPISVDFKIRYFVATVRTLFL